MNLLETYSELVEKYGLQGWWPLVKNKVPTYIPGEYLRPTSEEEAFEICTGAILAQNVNWKNAQIAVLNLCNAKLLTSEKIAFTQRKKLEVLIRPSGFYSQKAMRLQEFARKWRKVALSSKKSTAKFRNFLLSLNGVGKETADSIALYAFKKPTFVIDAYTRKFCVERKFFKETNLEYDAYKEFFEENLPVDYKIYNEFHALIVKHVQETKKRKYFFFT